MHLPAGDKVDKRSGGIAVRIDRGSETPISIWRERTSAQPRHAWPGASLPACPEIPIVQRIVITVADEESAAPGHKLAKADRPRMCGEFLQSNAVLQIPHSNCAVF